MALSRRDELWSRKLRHACATTPAKAVNIAPRTPTIAPQTVFVERNKTPAVNTFKKPRRFTDPRESISPDLDLISTSSILRKIRHFDVRRDGEITHRAQSENFGEIKRKFPQPPEGAASPIFEIEINGRVAVGRRPEFRPMKRADLTKTRHESNRRITGIHARRSPFQPDTMGIMSA